MLSCQILTTASYQVPEARMLLLKCKSGHNTPLKSLQSRLFHSEKAKILKNGLQAPHDLHCLTSCPINRLRAL